MVAQKEVKVKVATEEELSGVEAIEQRVAHLKRQQIQMRIDLNSQKLDETRSKIDNLKEQKANLEVGVDDSEIKKIESEIASLEQEAIALEIAVETDELKKAKSEIEELDGTEINLEANMSMQNISQGISQAKEGISELKQSMDEVAQAGMQSEQNKAFLEMNLGADKAKQTYQEISDIVASMPGDDNTMRSVLSTAQALGNNLNPTEMKDAAGTMADYMSASATMGKMATESQQDIMKYLLDGNTAELERGSIVSSQVDKLKEAKTFQERQVAMQQVLNDLGYGGISQQDTMLNKQAEWEGMIYNSQDALSSMWLGAEKGAMDYIIKLNDASGGLLGMGIVAGQMAAGPLVDVFSGLGQIAVGMGALKDLKIIQWFKDLEIMTKLSAAADWLLSGAQAVLNAVMSMNPIVLVVLALVALAAALIWAYYNVDWFREMVDDFLGQLQQLAGTIWNTLCSAVEWLGQVFANTGQIMQDTITNAVNWVITTLQGLWTYIITLGGLLPENVSITGNQIIDSVLRVMAFIATLPFQLAMVFTNVIAKTLGFGDNFVQKMIKSGADAVNGFIRYITQLPGIVMGEFNRVLGLVNDFINSIPSRVWDMGVAIIDALKRSLGIGSPGHMFYMVEGEFDRIDNLTQKTRFDTASIGNDMVNSFNPNLEPNTGAQGVSQVNNFYFEDLIVDDDKRMERIYDYITRRLSFNNSTAGRTR